MSLERKLGAMQSQFYSEVSSLLSFVKDVASSLAERSRAFRLLDLSPGDLAAWDQFFKFVSDAHHHVPRARKKIEIRSQKLGPMLLDLARTEEQKAFLAEMSLSHLVCLQEGFLKDYVRVILCNRKELLKCNKQVSYEEVCSRDSIASLVSYLAQKEVDAMGHGSIDDWATYFESRLNIRLQGFPGWAEIREASYRRNLIVHNRGVTNDIYCSKTSHKKKGELLVTDLRYVVGRAKTLLKFIRYVHKQLRTKLKLGTGK